MRVKIQYTVDPNRLDTVKTSASRYLSSVPPGLRVEVLARGLGFNTWASMKVSTCCRKHLNVSLATDFAASRGISVEPLDLHLTMAGASLLRVAAMTPELHLLGTSISYFSLSSEEMRAIWETHPASEAVRQVETTRLAKFEEKRALLFENKQAEQTLRALALFSALKPTKTVGAKARSSYGIKHLAEAQAYDLGDGIVLRPDYVSNVDVMVAALDGGFPTKHHGGSSPNVSIGIAVASLGLIEAD